MICKILLFIALAMMATTATAMPQPDSEDRSLYAEDFTVCYNYWIELLSTHDNQYWGSGSGWGPDGSGYYSGSYAMSGSGSGSGADT